MEHFGVGLLLYNYLESLESIFRRNAHTNVKTGLTFECKHLMRSSIVRSKALVESFPTVYHTIYIPQVYVFIKICSKIKLVKNKNYQNIYVVIHRWKALNDGFRTHYRTPHEVLAFES